MKLTDGLLRFRYPSYRHGLVTGALGMLALWLAVAGDSQWGQFWPVAFGFSILADVAEYRWLRKMERELNGQ